jgi:hypothetical protein
MLITFSGLDGSGKSTLISRLASTLEAARTPVVVRHMNYDVGLLPLVHALWRRLRDGRSSDTRPRDGTKRWGTRPPDAHLDRWRRLRSAIVWNKTFRRVVYPVDLLIFAGYRLYVERLSGRVLIMDRYFYDTLVDIASPDGWGWARLLARITPAPDLAVFLETSAEEAFARKGEFSVDYLARRSLAYQRVLGWVPSAVVLNNVDCARSAGEITRLVAQAGGRDTMLRLA